MKLLVDMNLGRDWVAALAAPGVAVQHWREIGPAAAPDHDILAWAKQHSCVVISKDLDMPQLLFATRDQLPSVVLLRIRDLMEPTMPARVIAALQSHAGMLQQGCIMVIDEFKVRVRMLPL